MHIINVTVRDKIATYVGDVYYVCGNSDFVVHFDFDDEWAALEVKTARFICEDGSFRNQVFSGSECPVPIISNTNNIRVGVYAGNLCTTTPARVPAAKSILCPGGMPAAPEDDTYNQIMEGLNAAKGTAEDTAKTLQDAFGEGGLFLIREVKKGTTVACDRTIEEVRDAVAAGKTCLLIDSEGRIFSYYAEDTYHNDPTVKVPTFIAPGSYLYTTGIEHMLAQIRPEGGNLLCAYTKSARTPNPYKLTIGGQTYDGSKAVSVDIPAILEDKQFVVTVVSTSTGWVSDRSRAEIDAAQAAGKACLMHFPDSGEVMTYHGGYKFASNVYINNASAPGLYYDWAVVNDDKTVDKYGGGPLTAYPGAVSSSKGTCYLRWNGSAWEAATIAQLKSDLGLV